MVATGLVTAKAPKRKEQVLAAAARIMREKGVAAARLQDVAAHLDLAYPALYHYFKSRDHMAEEVLCWNLANRRQRLESAVGESALDRLLQFMVSDLAGDKSHEVSMPLRFALPGPQRKAVDSARNALLDRIAALIEQGIEEGSVRRCHPLTIANVVLGSLERYVAADARARMGDAAMNRLAARVADVYRVGILEDRGHVSRPSFSIERGEELLGTEVSLDPELARWDEIIRTATRHFNVEGERASIPRIAAELGVSKTVIYQYALDKQDLMFQCYSRGARVVEASHRIASNRGRDALDEMLIHRENLYRYHASTAGPFALLSSMSFLKPQHLRLMQLSNRGVRLTSQERMTRAIREGFVRADVDPAVVQPLFGEALYGLPFWYTTRYPLSIEEVCRQTGLVHFVGLAH